MNSVTWEKTLDKQTFIEELAKMKQNQAKGQVSTFTSDERKQEIVFAFRDSLRRLREIDRELDRQVLIQKGDEIIRLAKKLAQIIPPNEVCKTIVDWIGGLNVSASFIRKCLPKEYKDTKRAENAKRRYINEIFAVPGVQNPEESFQELLEGDYGPALKVITSPKTKQKVVLVSIPKDAAELIAAFAQGKEDDGPLNVAFDLHGRATVFDATYDELYSMLRLSSM